MIDLCTAPTPNGWKVSVALEELGLPYAVRTGDAQGRSLVMQWLMFQTGGTYRRSGVPIDGPPRLRRSMDAMKARPACGRGIEMPFELESALKDDVATQAFAERAARRAAPSQAAGSVAVVQTTPQPPHGKTP